MVKKSTSISKMIEATTSSNFNYLYDLITLVEADRGETRVIDSFENVAFNLSLLSNLLDNGAGALLVRLIAKGEVCGEIGLSLDTPTNNPFHAPNNDGSPDGLPLTKSAAIKQVIDITAVADVASSLNNTYVIFYTSRTSAAYFWISVDFAGANPNPVALRPGTSVLSLGAVNISSNATAATVAAAIETMLIGGQDNGVIAIEVTRSTNQLTITNRRGGSATSPRDFGTGFTLARTTAGVDATDTVNLLEANSDSLKMVAPRSAYFGSESMNPSQRTFRELTPLTNYNDGVSLPLTLNQGEALQLEIELFSDYEGSQNPVPDLDIEAKVSWSETLTAGAQSFVRFKDVQTSIATFGTIQVVPSDATNARTIRPGYIRRLRAIFVMGNSTGIVGSEKFTVTIQGTIDAADYWTFDDATDASYYVWYNTTGSDTDPAPGGTGIEVDASGSVSRPEIAKRTKDAIDASAAQLDIHWQGFYSNARVLTCTTPGNKNRTSATQGTTGFGIIIDRNGGSATGNTMNMSFNLDNAGSVVSASPSISWLERGRNDVRQNQVIRDQQLASKVYELLRATRNGISARGSLKNGPPRVEDAGLKSAKSFISTTVGVLEIPEVNPLVIASGGTLHMEVDFSTSSMTGSPTPKLIVIRDIVVEE